LNDRLFGVPGVSNFRQCDNPDCRLLWLDPRTIDEDLPELYRNYQTHRPVEPPPPRRFARLREFLKRSLLAEGFGYHDLKPVGPFAGIAHILARSRLLRSRLGRSIMWLNGEWRGRLLDVGCGNGAFLLRMQTLGWRGVGVDFDAAAIRVARDAHRLEAYCGRLDDVPLRDGSFDVITMAHVIEHVPDPKRTFEQCARLLKPGGRLVVVTPNGIGLGHSRFGRHWFALDPPRHLFIFTPRSLAECATAAGLDVVDCWTEAGSGAAVSAKSRMIQKLGRIADYDQSMPLPIGPRLFGAVFGGVEHLLSAKRQAGEEIFMIARTPETPEPLTRIAAS
jgi:SAM-dependent methyltransferase